MGKRHECKGAPAGFEADCGEAGPHGWHLPSDPEGPSPYGTKRADPEECYHDRTDPETGRCYACGKKV